MRSRHRFGSSRERNSPDGSDRGPSVGTAPARRPKRTLDGSPRVLDSSGPWSPKPARIYANPRVRPTLRAPRRPHCHAVSGASSRLLRLPENRGVPGSIPGLATPRFCLLFARFCARRPAALRSRWGRLSAFRVQLSVLNGPHSGVEAPTAGDKTAAWLARLPGRRSRPPRGLGPGVRERPGVARRPRAAAKRPSRDGTATPPPRSPPMLAVKDDEAMVKRDVAAGVAGGGSDRSGGEPL